MTDTSFASTRPTWWTQNRTQLLLSLRVLFGIVWVADGIMKFVWLVPSDVTDLVQGAGQGQPAWLQGWFGFWSGLVAANPAFFLYGTGLAELALGLALLFGLLRKTSYLLGILLSLLIWTVDEGFGGPYGQGSTDIGAAIMYAILFFALLLAEATAKSNRYTLDAWIERRLSWWRRLAETSYEE